MKGLTLTQKEQARLQVLNGILEGQISVDEAAEVLGVSERHVWRILAEYRKEGAAALAHGNRGRRANNSIPEEARTQVVALARTRYARVNHTHLTELLAEREEIVLGRSTVRRILVGAGMASPRRRRPPLHRVRRQRMSPGRHVGASRWQRSCLARKNGALDAPCCWQSMMPPAPCPTHCFAMKRTLMAISSSCKS